MSFYKRDVDGNVIRNRVILVIPEDEEVRVEQSHKDEVNINNIVRKHGLELIAKTQALQELRFDDVVGNDFQESMNMLLKAKESFESVPSEIRKRFDNDPAKFMDFVHNGDNKDEMVKLGLMRPEDPAPEPIQVVMVNPQETPPAEPAP
jgi:phage internal scaffolding protein